MGIIVSHGTAAKTLEHAINKTKIHMQIFFIAISPFEP